MHGDFPFKENFPAAQSVAKLGSSNVLKSRTAACTDADRMVRQLSHMHETVLVVANANSAS